MSEPEEYTESEQPKLPPGSTVTSFNVEFLKRDMVHERHVQTMIKDFVPVLMALAEEQYEAEVRGTTITPIGRNTIQTLREYKSVIDLEAAMQAEQAATTAKGRDDLIGDIVEGVMAKMPQTKKD